MVAAVITAVKLVRKIAGTLRGRSQVKNFVSEDFQQFPFYQLGHNEKSQIQYYRMLKDLMSSSQ